MSEQRPSADRLDELEAKVDALLNAREYLKDELAAARAENEEQREEIETLKQQVGSLTAELAGERTARETDTKKGLAEQIARDEGVRVARKGLRGGAVDWPTVRDIADREYDTDLNSGTVYAAFDALEDEWAAFHVREGEEGPNTRNKQLVCDAGRISDALRRACDTGGN